MPSNGGSIASGRSLPICAATVVSVKRAGPNENAATRRASTCTEPSRKWNGLGRPPARESGRRPVRGDLARVAPLERVEHHEPVGAGVDGEALAVRRADAGRDQRQALVDVRVEHGRARVARRPHLPPRAAPARAARARSRRARRGRRRNRNPRCLRRRRRPSGIASVETSLALTPPIVMRGTVACSRAGCRPSRPASAAVERDARGARVELERYPPARAQIDLDQDAAAVETRRQRQRAGVRRERRERAPQRRHRHRRIVDRAGLQRVDRHVEIVRGVAVADVPVARAQRAAERLEAVERRHDRARSLARDLANDQPAGLVDEEPVRLVARGPVGDHPGRVRAARLPGQRAVRGGPAEDALRQAGPARRPADRSAWRARWRWRRRASARPPAGLPRSAHRSASRRRGSRRLFTATSTASRQRAVGVRPALVPSPRSRVPVCRVPVYRSPSRWPPARRRRSRSSAASPAGRHSAPRRYRTRARAHAPAAASARSRVASRAAFTATAARACYAG